MCFKLATCADFTRPCISDFDELFSVYTKPTLVITASKCIHKLLIFMYLNVIGSSTCYNVRLRDQE